MVQAFFPGLKDAEITPHFKWKQFFMLNHRLLTYNGESVSVELLNEVLDSVRLSGEMVACELGVSFKSVLSLRLGTKTKLYEFIHTACTQKPPSNLSEDVYNWWSQAVPQVRQSIQERLADASAARKEAARASFDSFVNLVSKALAYLDRFHVKRLSLPTLAEVAAPEQDALRQAFAFSNMGI